MAHNLKDTAAILKNFDKLQDKISEHDEQIGLLWDRVTALEETTQKHGKQLEQQGKQLEEVREAADTAGTKAGAAQQAALGAASQASMTSLEVQGPQNALIVAHKENVRTFESRSHSAI